MLILTVQLWGIGCAWQIRKTRYGDAQGREIIPRITVRENLLLGLEGAKHRTSKDTDRELQLVFELFPVLASMQKRMGGDLSGGQQQLAIARALLGKPQLLLLDEPTEGIQPSIVLEIEQAVRQIVAETGIGVLLVEQHLHFVKQPDYYYAMQKGRIVASGSTAQLTSTISLTVGRSPLHYPQRIGGRAYCPLPCWRGQTRD